MNLGFTYYRNIANTNIDYGKEIVAKSNLFKEGTSIFFNINDSYKISFKTTYPGLAIGLGYIHESDEIDDYKMGMSFDYTTGVPYIPGSSVKGTLRSVFPIDKNDENRIAFINECLGIKEDKDKKSYEEILALEYSIFGKRTDDSSSKDNQALKDIFYDGYIDTNSSFLHDDYITPHPSEIKSPEPKKFLRVLQGTTITLQFKLNKKNELISIEKRLELFSEILKFTGIGAKTNVGYGQLDEDSIKFGYKDLVFKDTEILFAEKENLIQIEKNALIKAQEEHEKEALLSSVNSALDKLKIEIQGKADNKEIFDILQTYKFEESEISDVKKFVFNLIGPKPQKDKPAPRKWAIKIYEHFGM